jgi:hypothetical protein
MLYISTSPDAKSHILGTLSASREVTTVCGLTHPETDFKYNTESDENLCARCSGKVDLEPEVDKTETDEVVLDKKPVEKDEPKAPTSSDTSKK